MSEIELRRRRILVDGRPSLLLAGEIHYFRLDPQDWSDRLDRLVESGCDTLATYIPWLWHELPDRSIDLTGRTDPRRNLTGFLDLAYSRGLRVIARPGPFIMAELKNEGIPYRVYDDAPHVLPITWDGRTIETRTIDYLAPDFLDAVRGWYGDVMPLLAQRLAPRGGPIVAVQLDNEIGMLSWLTNSPDLTDLVCDDLSRWCIERYGKDGAAHRFGADPGDPAAWAAAVRTPREDRSLAVHDDLGRYTRDRYRRYVLKLRNQAERYGVTGVPLVVNVHGTAGGRGRTFPVGISQLFESYRGQPQMTSGSDYYLGDLTVTNVADLYVSNAFLAAVHDADQPITSMEFEAGNGDYGEDLSTLYPPEAIDLKTRLCVAQGNRLLNLYLFAGGHNPPLAEPIGDGNDRIAFTGERHGFAAPVGPEGQLNPTFDAARAALRSVRAVADLLADSDEENDGLALGFVPDHYLTEYHHPASASRTAQVVDLEHFRGMGPRDILARALLLGGFSFPAVDVQSAPLGPQTTPVLALASAGTMRRDTQHRLVAYVRAGGRLLLHGVLPERDHDGEPCTVLADELGLRIIGRSEGGRHYFPSVVGHGWAAGRAEVRVGYAQHLEPVGDDARLVLSAVGSGAGCAYETSAGDGKALVIACDYPCLLDFWRSALDRLGVRRRLAHDAEQPGLVVTSTVNPAGERLLHLVNVGPSPADFGLTWRGARLLGGRRLHLPARAGVMLPYGLRVGEATLVETTCELVWRDGSSVLLRPTQDVDLVVLDTHRTVIASRGDVEVSDGRVTVTVRDDGAAEPLRIDLR
jgi:beta-galactosidase